MPSPLAFTKAFKINKGSIIGNWQIRNLSIGHEVIKRFREYKFPLEITLEHRGEPKESLFELLDEIQNHTREKKVVNSQYGNPYLCYIKDWEFIESSYNDGFTIVKIKATGVGLRQFS